MPPVKEGEAGMEPDTQLKRARLSFIGQKPVQHRPSSWNGKTFRFVLRTANPQIEFFEAAYSSELCG
eukprot:2465948-Rhodomonas_salina.1